MFYNFKNINNFMSQDGSNSHSGENIRLNSRSIEDAAETLANTVGQPNNENGSPRGENLGMI